MKKWTVTALILTAAVRLSAQDDTGQKLLWHIGKPDRGNSEFALSPKQYGQYREDGFHIVGRSDSRASWPYVHPGPADQWAGARRHTFTILFGLAGTTGQGSCSFRLDLLDTHSQAPPRLLIRVNGKDFGATLPAGSADKSLEGEPALGKRHTVDVKFPAEILKAGDNEITIESVSGSWFLYDWLGLEAPAGVTPAPVSARTSILRSKSLPFLQDRGGQLCQFLQLTVVHTGDSCDALVSLQGTGGTAARLKPGIEVLEIPLPALADSALLDVRIAVFGRNADSIRAALAPVRRLTIYVTPHSHTDIGYTDIQGAIEQKQVENLLKGIEYARKTAEYPEGARFVWNVEVLWAADLYLRRLSEPQRQEFVDAVRRGWVSLNGMYLNELTGLCRPEELLRLFRYSTQLAERCSTTIDAAMISDVPGYTWGSVTAMAQAGIRYFSTAPNYFDRIGDILVRWENKPFYWESPSGKERVLVWIPYKGYAMSHGVERMSQRFVEEYMAQVDRAHYPYDIIYMRWSGHGDNAVPEIEVSDFVKEWNAHYAWPHFIISGTSEAFRTFEQKYGGTLPTVRGDWTPYWEDGAGSSALETAMNRASADRLVQAQTLWAMFHPSGYPAGAFEEAWRNVLLYSEHTWGAWCSVSDPESKTTKEQWEIKRSYAVQADSLSRRLLAGVLGDLSPAKGPIDVFNTTSWERTEIVILPRELSASGDRVTDAKGRPVPSQRLATGELAFLASGVPPFSSRRYAVSKGRPFVAAKVTTDGFRLENESLTARLDAKTGGIVELVRKGTAENLVDTTSGQRLNEYLFLPGDSLKDLQTNGPVRISVQERGPLIATLRVRSDAPGGNSLTRDVRLVAGFDHVELINTLDKKRAAVSPTPGSWQFAQKGGKESVNFGFPFNVAGGSMLLDIPLGAMRPETDQMPSACKNWFTVGRWADVSGAGGGVTWVTLDAPLVEVGAITATLTGSQANPDLWRTQVEPTQRLYSWAMNNHWHTNYRAYQEGVVQFRYALRVHDRFDAAGATRFATSLSQPLIARAAAGGATAVPRLRVAPEGVVVISFTPADDGKGWILTLFGASGRTETATLTWAEPAPRTVRMSDTSQKPLGAAPGEIEVPAWGVVTLRADF